jgi:two-component system chemotaxis sensor kinase CheA
MIPGSCFDPLHDKAAERQMTIDDADLIREFAIESQEHLSDIENQLLTLESQGDDVDVALVNTLFRAIHSIKGAAGFMGLSTLGGLAHRAEEVLNRLRNRDLRPTSAVINSLLRATDRLKYLVDHIETSNDIDVAEQSSALDRILQGDLAGAASATCAAVSTPEHAIARSENKISPEALRDFLIESFENLDQLERDLMSLERDVASAGIVNGVFRNVHTIKGTAGFVGFTQLERASHAAENLLGGIRDGRLAIDYSISAAMFRFVDLIRSSLKSIESTGEEGSGDFEVVIDLLRKLYGDKSQQSVATPKPEKLPKAPVAEHPSDREVRPTSTRSDDVVANESSRATTAPAGITGKVPANNESVAESTIRVDVALLDKLMTRVGELVLARNQIVQVNSVIGDNALQKATQRLNLITTELQECVMKTRMQPIGNVWSKFPRLVRDLAGLCGKQVRVEMDGKETELDKTIIEAIKDPLTHLVRNTVDHGIEKPADRTAVGKPVEGCLTLRAYHEGGQVNIEIVDDGGGLKLDRIKQKAIEKGLLNSEQATKLSDRDVGMLIFLPGFSTAEKVSNVSGRGVGMDVVKTNIEKIGGTVDLQSVSGQGTTIKIKIPLTLAIVPAIVVTSAGDRYAIPQVSLLELVRLEGDDAKKNIEWIRGAPVYRLRGQLLPLVYLRDELRVERLNQREKECATNIVVLRADDRQFGLVVDSINDSEEIVVKPLSNQLKGVAIYSGATIMGDGSVALILDVMGLAQSAHVISTSRDRTTVDTANRSSMGDGQSRTYLISGVGENRRFALPIDQVTRLEKLNSSSVEYADAQEVVQYRGEILPLVRLSDVLGVPSSPANPHEMDVIVYREKARCVGLVVDRVLDIVDTKTANTYPAQRVGLVNSEVIHDHVTAVLDLPSVIASAIPSFFESAHGV